MKVLIFVCGEGLGHTGRCISLANEFQAAGHDVFIGAYGYSRELIEKSGHVVSPIPQELKLTGSDGFLDLKSSIRATIGAISLKNINIVQNLVKKVHPDVIISDGYYLGVLSAMRQKVPRCMIVNQSSMQDFFRDKGPIVRLAGTFVRIFYSWIYDHLDIIFVPDFAPPATICGSNLSFSGKVLDKVEFSGPLLRKRPGDVEPASLPHPHVLCSIGGFGYRLRIFRTLLEAARMDPGIHYTLIGGPDLDYDRLEDVPLNVDVRKLIPDPFPYYMSSDAVICTGGHGTLSEALSFGLPVISFPDRLHNEQHNNATRMENNGYGRKLSYQVFPDKLLETIRSLVYEDRFRLKAVELKEQARRLHGPAYVRQRLEAVCDGSASQGK